MKFQSNINEVLFISEITPTNKYMFNQDLKTGLSIVWNVGQRAIVYVDGAPIELSKNTAIFLTELHQLGEIQFDRLNVIQFNRPFYCVEKHDSEVGCRGILFFGASEVPRIKIETERLKQLQLIWKLFMMEMEDESDGLKQEMLQIMLKRFLIICVRIYKQDSLNLPSEGNSIGVIREFNYLVEKHFRTLTKVGDYAKLLHKSPKTLANTFSKFINKTPLKIINERRLLEAKRLLKYSEKSVQEIAYELSFNDIQSFSHFFRTRLGQSPSAFKKGLMD
ncbi:MAG: helix-turn-helix domain-containing protein [Saprospiraceae bacterium]